MDKVNRQDHLAIARINEYCADRAPWNRTLWACGSILHLREVLGAADAVANSILSENSLKDLQSAARETAGGDAGLGSPGFRNSLRVALEAEIRPGNIEWHTIDQTIVEAESEYLVRWAESIESTTDDMDVERVARYIASYLLDRGHSKRWIREWFSRTAPRRETVISILPGLLRELDVEIKSPDLKFRAILPLREQPLGIPTRVLISGKDAADWIRRQGGDTSGMRINTAIQLAAIAKDRWSAIARLREHIDKIIARSLVGSSKPIRHLGTFWIDGHDRPESVNRPSRGVAIMSVGREDRVLPTARLNPRIDDAMSLIAVLDRGNPGPALATGWAAAESLLLAASESGNHVRVADRMAAIVTCSFPRAELTRLAHSHDGDDSLREQIQAAESNRDRSELVLEHLSNGERLCLHRVVDKISELRMLRLLGEPGRVLGRIQGHQARCLRRFYRQRNLMVHGGVIDGVATLAALRTGAPLIGAALDRVHHAWATEAIEPVALAARAQRSLRLARESEARRLTRLLEPPLE